MEVVGRWVWSQVIAVRVAAQEGGCQRRKVYPLRVPAGSVEPECWPGGWESREWAREDGHV